MKRNRMIAVLTSFLLCLCMGNITMAVQAAGNLPRVVDDADLLEDSQESALEEKLGEISEKYQCDVVIVTEDSLDGKEATPYADDYYDYNGYGYGENHDGILLLVSMAERKWAISTTGYGIEVFTDAGQEYMVEKFKPYLSDGEYEESFTCFADLCDEFLRQAQEGKPYDIGNLPKEKMSPVWILVAVGIGFVISLLVTGTMKGQLKSVRSQPAADNYVKPGSFQLRRERDVFLYRTVNRVKKPEPQSSGGGSSTHTGSSGTTHGGSSGDF